MVLCDMGSCVEINNKNYKWPLKDFCLEKYFFIVLFSEKNFCLCESCGGVNASVYFVISKVCCVTLFWDILQRDCKYVLCLPLSLRVEPFVAVGCRLEDKLGCN